MKEQSRCMQNPRIHAGQEQNSMFTTALRHDASLCKSLKGIYSLV